LWRHCALAPLRAGRGLRPGPALCFPARAPARAVRPRAAPARVGRGDEPL